MNATPRVIVVAADAERQRELSATLASASYELDPVPAISVARDALRQQPPDLVIVDAAGIPPSEFTELRRATQAVQVGLMVLMPDIVPTGSEWDDADDWLTWGRRESELIPRVARLLRRSAAPPPLADARFLALIVHDLRTPLNVFTLTIRALSQSVKAPTPDFEEDLSFLLENAKQIERMLAQLGDYSRLIESRGRSATTEFQTRRFLTEFLEEKQTKRDSEFKGVRLEIMPDTPEVVELDPTLARLALHHALANAAAAALEAPIRLRSSGTAEDWLLEVIVEKPSPATVNSTHLHSNSFERLIGSAAERRGFDLAIASLVAKLFKGSTRLEIEPGARSSIRFSWPVRSASSTV